MNAKQKAIDTRVNAPTRINHMELARIKRLIEDRMPTDGTRKMRITDAVRFLLDFYDAGKRA